MVDSSEFLYLWAQWGVLNFDQYCSLRKQFSSLQSAWKKIIPRHFQAWGMGGEKIERIFELRSRLDFQKLTQTLAATQTQIFSLDCPQYPQPLREIAQPPPFLFVRGTLPPLNKALAVVGTRRATEYGRQVTEALTTGLVQRGFTIISGLALGIDTVAHQTALHHQGRTIAVLGSSVDQIYPASNQKLAETILSSGGALLSAYPLGTPALAHHFPARNALVSGLARGVLVVEGGLNSGALITARLALEQGREVFAVPHDITKKGLEGTHALIRRGEAKLVSGVEDILEEFQLSPEQTCLFQTNIGVRRVGVEIVGAENFEPLRQALEKEPKTADELSEILSFPIAELTSQLVELQLQGLVRQQGERWVMEL